MKTKNIQRHILNTKPPLKNTGAWMKSISTLKSVFQTLFQIPNNHHTPQEVLALSLNFILKSSLSLSPGIRRFTNSVVHELHLINVL